MAGFVGLEFAHGTVLHGTGAVAWAKGLPGAGGVARDTLLQGVYIKLGAGPATLTITGMGDEAGVARNWVLSGVVATDTWYPFTHPILNEFAAFTFTASVADVVTVFTKAFAGP